MLDDKSSYRLLFGDVRRPRELVRCVDGVCFSADDRVLSCRDAVSEVVAYGQPVIVKPTSDSGCGKGVQFISDFAPYRLTKLFEEYGRNFVVQQLVRQSEETAVFNPTSLNTFRVSSLFMNGVFSIQSIIMRVGGRGSRVDNVGAGGFAVGVEQDGRLMNFGYGKDGKVNEGYNGEKFASCRIRSLGNVIDLVESCHKRIPWVPYVGWDVALDATGNGVLIELNSGFPGILYEQLCTGPLFSPGNRFDEVMEYARTHSPDVMPSLYYLRSDFYHSHVWQ